MSEERMARFYKMLIWTFGGYAVAAMLLYWIKPYPIENLFTWTVFISPFLIGSAFGATRARPDA